MTQSVTADQARSVVHAVLGSETFHLLLGPDVLGLKAKLTAHMMEGQPLDYGDVRHVRVLPMAECLINFWAPQAVIQADRWQLAQVILV